MFEMKKKLRWSALKSGLVISLVLLILFVVVLYAGTVRRIFTPTVELRARFHDVKGLRRGAPVWLFGTEVGSVQKIQLDPVYGLIVTFSLEKKAEHYLRSDSKAEVMTMGLLGDTYVQLSPGAHAAPPLEPGEMLQGKTPVEYTEVVREGARAVEKITELSRKVETLVVKISEGHGTLPKLINDSTLYDNLVKSTETLQAELEDLRKSRGTLRLLIEDPALYNRTLAAVSDLKAMTHRLNAGQGTLGKLLVDSELYDNLDKSARNLDEILSSINKGQGMAGALVRDKKIVDEVKNALLEIRRVAEEMKNLLKEVKEHPDKYFKFSVF